MCAAFEFYKTALKVLQTEQTENKTMLFHLLKSSGVKSLAKEGITKITAFALAHLIEDAKNKGKKVGVFPIDDDAWIDVGQWTEYRQAVERL